MNMQIRYSNTNFKSGLTSQMKREIASCDVKKISHEFAKQGIENNFKNNKVIAWCCLKGFEIIKTLQTRFNFQISYPNAILVEDFKSLKLIENAFGCTNWFQVPISSHNNKILSGKTILFNEFKDFNIKNSNIIWDNIDSFSDQNYDNSISTTSFFLETFLHEFAHVMHENNLINKLGEIKTITNVQKFIKQQAQIKFQQKYKGILCNISEYATLNPMEAIASDFSKRIITNLDQNTLVLNNDCIKNSPYAKEPNLFVRIFNSEDNLIKTLRHFWNGQFD